MRFNPWSEPLVPGTLIQRYKRFLADIRISDGEEVTVHCPNPGSMLGMAEPGSEVMISRASNPKRKLPWTWELVRPPGETWVGCNTAITNSVARWAIETGQAPGLTAADGIRAEVPFGTSRFDFVLGTENLHYVEVKNTTLRGGGAARFPDSVTARGTKHVTELAEVVAAGHQATMLFFVNRGDCDRFEVATDIDPTYGSAFDEATANGVNVLALAANVSPLGWEIKGPLPIG